MTFTLDDALPYLRCPVSGAPLFRDGVRDGAGEGESLVTASGLRYPIRDGIADLTENAAAARPKADYDQIAGLKYNLWIFNPAAMAFTWGVGVLKAPLLMRTKRALVPGLVLEVPCGTGIFTARAYKQSPESKILAVDYSLGMLRAARNRARKLGVRNAVFIRADVAKLPIADGVLDGCLSLAGFHAFPDPEAAARSIGRALKPGAQAMVTVACSGERKISDLMVEHVMKPGRYFTHGLSADTYRSFLERAGLTQMHVQMAGALAVMRGVKA